MWLSIISLFIGGIPAIVQAIGKAKYDAMNAKTEQDRIAANERVKSLEAQRDVLIANSKSPWDSIARFFIAAPFALYFWWIIVNDKIVCKWYTEAADVARVCRTDSLSPWLEGIAGGILAFWFLFRKR